MRGTFEFCLPTKSDAVPTGPDWLHEIVRVERDGDVKRRHRPPRDVWLRA
jgi:hypothetical protein